MAALRPANDPPGVRPREHALMPATTNKQQQLAHVQSVLKKKVAAPPPAENPRPVLDEVLFGIVREAATPEQADIAFARMKSEFFDLNEIRVSTVQEVADALTGLPDAGGKAKRLIDFLQEHFERTYSFALDDLEKKGLKQAAKQLARYKDHGVTDFVVAWVTQRALGGHAVPLDEPTVRVLSRLGILEADLDDPEEARGSLEHFVTKAAGPEFTDRIAAFAAAVCVDDAPACGTCPMKSECPSAAAFLAKAKEPKDVKKPKPK